MLETIFLPFFLQTLAVVAGIGSGLILVFIAVLAVIVITYPITTRLKK